MTVYVGTLVPPAGPLARLPMCFTGAEAVAMRALIGAAEVLTGAALGFALGALLGFLAGPETVLPGAIVGAIAGALGGLIVAVGIVVKSMCPCPAGSTGFCIVFIFLRVPGTGILLPLWPGVLPDPASCPVLVPPGCP